MSQQQTATTNASPAAALLKGRSPMQVLLVLCIGVFLIFVDTTIVNVAFPTLINTLKAGLDQILWISNAYLLIYAALILIAGRLGDYFGPKRLFLAGLAVFTLASLLSGLSQNAPELIAMRVLQGIGAALLTPQPLVLASVLFPPERRGTAFGIITAMAGAASITGPLIGGTIVTYLTWQWIFFINVPIGILGIILTLMLVPDLRPARKHSFDLIGVLLAATGLSGIIFALIEGERYGWGAVLGSLTIPEILVAGIALLVLFVLWESRSSEPLVPLHLFKNRNFAIVCLVNVVWGFALLGFLVTLAIELQSVLGWTPLQAGAASLPMTLTLGLLAPFAGALTDRIGGRYTLAFGLSVYAVGVLLFALLVSTSASFFTFIAPLLLIGAGIGFTVAPSTTEGMREVPPQLAGVAAGLFNTLRQVGSAAGGAVVGAILLNRLVANLHNQAVQRSADLPAQTRDQVVNGIATAAKQGLELGHAGGFTAAQLPAGIPTAAQPKILQIIHDVFGSAFIAAVRPTLAAIIAVLVLGVLGAIAMTVRHQATTATTANTPPSK